MSNPVIDSSGQLSGAAQSLIMGGSSSSTQSGAIPEHWRHCFPEIIGRSEPMLQVIQVVSKIARSESAVLIHGESGTGKELIAAALHRLSKRSAHPFIAINCSAIPESLLESELFGHEKGAFTGADRRRKGHFEMAAGGTIFLDEIGDMPLSLQAKLLRVLQEREFTPLGGNQLVKSDVRIIAATNVDLEKAVSSERFRMDLYYRLNVLPIRLPALRERSFDVPELLDHFLELVNRVHDFDKPCVLSQPVIEALMRYAWPGNVRELQNLIERLVVMCGGGLIELSHLPKEYLVTVSVGQPKTGVPEPMTRVVDPRFAGTAPLTILGGSEQIQFPANFGALPMDGVDLTNLIEQLENTLILQALERTQYNKNQAAKLLGLNRTTLVERIKKRQIVPLQAPSKEL